MCQMAVWGDEDGCRYAVCESCHVKSKPRGHQKSTSYEERKMTCHHEFHYFVDQYGLWWCKKKDINGWTWWKELKDVYYVGECLWLERDDDTLCKDKIPFNVKIIYNLFQNSLNFLEQEYLKSTPTSYRSWNLFTLKQRSNTIYSHSCFLITHCTFKWSIVHKMFVSHWK